MAGGGGPAGGVVAGVGSVLLDGGGTAIAETCDAVALPRSGITSGAPDEGAADVDDGASKVGDVRGVGDVLAVGDCVAVLDMVVDVGAGCGSAPLRAGPGVSSRPVATAPTTTTAPPTVAATVRGDAWRPADRPRCGR